MARFFLSCSTVDEAELRDFLLKRYHTLDFMNDMELISFIQLYRKAVENDQKERLYTQWCAMLPQFSKFISFNQFYDKATGADIDRRSVEEIMADIEETHRKAKEHNDGS